MALHLSPPYPSGPFISLPPTPLVPSSLSPLPLWSLHLSPPTPLVPSSLSPYPSGPFLSPPYPSGPPPLFLLSLPSYGCLRLTKESSRPCTLTIKNPLSQSVTMTSLLCMAFSVLCVLCVCVIIVMLTRAEVVSSMEAKGRVVELNVIQVCKGGGGGGSVQACHLYHYGGCVCAVCMTQHVPPPLPNTYLLPFPTHTSSPSQHIPPPLPNTYLLPSFRECNCLYFPRSALTVAR